MRIAASYQAQSEARRRQVLVNRKKGRTIDMHAHAYVHDVWPLIKDRKETPEGLADLANGSMALDAKTIDARLTEMDRQGIDSPRDQPKSSTVSLLGGAGARRANRKDSK